MRARVGANGRRRAARAAVVAACLLPTALASQPIGATPARAASATAALDAPPGADPAALDRTVRFLQEMQNADGGFGGVRGAASDPGISAWAAVALAATGSIRSTRQARRNRRRNLRPAHDRFRATTDYERVALMAIAAGNPLRDFNGTDLVAGIMRARLPSGAFAHGAASSDAVGGVNDTAFAIFALGGVQEPAVQAAVRNAAAWLLTVQNGDGGWEFHHQGTKSSADITGAVIQALRYAGRANTQAEQRGLAYLRTMQQPTVASSTASARRAGSNTPHGVGGPGPVGGGDRPGGWERAGATRWTICARCNRPTARSSGRRVRRRAPTRSG